MTSELVGRFVAAAVTGTRAAYEGEIHWRATTPELVVPDQVARRGGSCSRRWPCGYVMSDRRRLVRSKRDNGSCF